LLKYSTVDCNELATEQAQILQTETNLPVLPVAAIASIPVIAWDFSYLKMYML